ncbi:MAG: TolC family protein, partial [Bacteroides sp.]|nr:TolC family protein [Bacteroides sp.]
CYSDRPITPADSVQRLFTTPLAAGGASATHLGYFKSQAAEAKALVNIERSRFFPELSVGYSRQHILPLKNLNAWMIGASFPLYFVPQRSKVKQAKIAASAAEIQAEANIRELNNKVTELAATLRRCNESLRMYTTSALPEAEELIKVARLNLKHSETNITEFVQSVSTARDIRRGYIEIMYQFNVAVLEYELYN